MRIVIGILIFIIWSSLSSYWYVCKIKEVCKNEKITTVEPVNQVIVKKITAQKTQIQYNFHPLTIYFPFAQSEASLSEELSDSIKAFSEKLILAKKVVILTGNTDNIGSKSANQKLGLERANWVKKFLISLDVEEKNIEIKSFGESEPIEANNNKKGRSKNRRVEVRIQY